MVQVEHSGTKFGVLDITGAERIEHLNIFFFFCVKLPKKWPIDGKLITFCKGMLGLFGFSLHAANRPF